MSCSGTSPTMFPPPALEKCKDVICMRVSSGMLVPSFAGSTHMVSTLSIREGEIAKQLIQTIDEEKKLIEFKMLEGDLMEQYKTFLITLHIETKDDIDLVTWTLEYEMLNEDVDHPISLLAFHRPH
ncbi:Kirola [Sesamum angolense]|uniref:Kirola n=1 Tax=Sesamum angolense TaxID=2727404 RepID=A0AAE1WE93_9LAMI|nr:Kirola [Sesamum angolense]